MSIEVNITEQKVEVYDNGQRAYLAAYSTVDQTNAGATSENLMTYGTTDISRGVSIVASTKITIANAGIYNIQFSAQLNKAGGGTSLAQIWLKKNGENVSNSATEVTLAGNNARLVAAWNFVVQAAAGDYYELAWHSSDTTVFIDYNTTAVSPTRPAIPSIILTVTQV